MLAIAVMLASTLAALESPPPAHTCTPRDGLNYICGPVASEDLAQIPGTRFLVASGLNVGSPAHLYLVDDRDKSATMLFPPDANTSRHTPATAARCPGPPDPATLSIDGINIHAGRDGQHTLYAANHGDRHAIEFFAIDARGPLPTAAWTGCLLLPAGTLANAVVPLADGGLLFSSFYDPRDGQAWARMQRGEDTGSVWEWHVGREPRRVATGGISGANGLALSADERTIYVSAWSSGKLLLIDRLGATASGAAALGAIASGAAARREIVLGFLPDNIKRASDGTLFVAGQRSTVAKIAACKGPACPQDWIVARVDPARGTVTSLVTGPGNALVDYATGALQVGATLYITVRGDRRIAWLPVPDDH